MAKEAYEKAMRDHNELRLEYLASKDCEIHFDLFTKINKIHNRKVYGSKD